MDALLVHHKPFTMLDTAYGSEFRAPREAGSSVAQFGMADRDRRVVCDDDNLATAAAGPKRLPVVVSSNICLYEYYSCINSIACDNTNTQHCVCGG